MHNTIIVYYKFTTESVKLAVRTIPDCHSVGTELCYCSRERSLARAHNNDGNDQIDLNRIYTSAIGKATPSNRSRAEYTARNG